MTTQTLDRSATADQGASPSTPVVTGLGVTAPNGLGTEAWWAATLVLLSLWTERLGGVNIAGNRRPVGLSERGSTCGGS